MPTAIEKMKKLTSVLKARKDKEISTEDLILLIEEKLGVGETSAKRYIRDLWRRGIVVPKDSASFRIVV